MQFYTLCQHVKYITSNRDNISPVTSRTGRDALLWGRPCDLLLFLQQKELSPFHRIKQGITLPTGWNQPCGGFASISMSSAHKHALIRYRQKRERHRLQPICLILLNLHFRLFFLAFYSGLWENSTSNQCFRMFPENWHSKCLWTSQMSTNSV